MRPYYVLTLFVVTVFACAAGMGFALLVFNRTDSQPQAPKSTPTPTPLPSVALTPARITVQEFTSQYFKALNNHDFDTAYAFLSPSWGVDRQAYQRYWRQFEAGSIKSNILAIAPSPSKSVTVNWSGKYAGETVEIQFRCALSASATTYRIDRCQQTVLRGTAPR